MKTLIPGLMYLFLICSPFIAGAQTNQWTWVNGSDEIEQYGWDSINGYDSIPSEVITPGVRDGAVTWTDTNGDLWLYGGYGYASFTLGYLADLWKYSTATNTWECKKGMNAVNIPTVYGTQGISAPNNTPGRRYNAMGWIDNSGDFWLFGGLGVSGNNNDYSNDLWKYSHATNEWTWMKGTFMYNQEGTYGTINVAASSNNPGSRVSGSTWVDENGKFWLMGGEGYGNSSTEGMLNDIWRYDPITNEWTWVSGSNAIDETASYGTMGIPAPTNMPGARRGAVSLVDSTGSVWLFGGLGFNASSQGKLHDLWKYSPSLNEWTWISGSANLDEYGVYDTLQAASANNMPGARENARGFIDGSGNLWYMSGYGYSASGQGQLNDIWSFSPVTNLWTWERGSTNTGATGEYGTQGFPADSTVPMCRANAQGWIIDTNNFWLFGGFRSSSFNRLNDLWHFNITTEQWTWVHGSSSINQRGIYNALETEATLASPGARTNALTWTDSLGYFWLYGGYGYAASGNGYLADLWRYSPNTNTWAFIHGNNLPNQYGRYDTLGYPHPDISPGARSQAVTWYGDDGQLWLYGGSGPSMSGILGAFNDLWKFNTQTLEWTWVKGSPNINQYPTLGTQGIPDSANNPRGVFGAHGWKDLNGNFWLHGGRTSNGFYAMNDLWKFNPTTNEWTWVKGDNASYVPGDYGTKGVPSPTNKPGGRYDASSWVDQQGDFWLFGGIGKANFSSSGNLNDLWKFNITSNEWTWMKGSAQIEVDPTSVVNGSPNMQNTPGSLTNALNWVGPEGNLWLFGGFGYGIVSYFGLQSELWKYSPISNMWTMVYENGPFNEPDFGTLGITSPSNAIGSKSEGSAWVDTNGTFYLFGGNGVTQYFEGFVNDLWTFNPQQCAMNASISNVDDALCFGDSTGTISVGVNGASGSLQYFWNNGEQSQTLGNLPAGIYTITVVDGTGCAQVASDTVSEPSLLESSIDVIDESCIEANDGELSAIPNGGTPNYYFVWNDPQMQTTQTISQLAPGTYEVTITDQNGCTTSGSESVLIGNTPPIVDLGPDTVITSGDSIVLNPGNYASYLWSDNSTASLLTVSQTGSYWLTAADDNGCVGHDTIQITIWPTGINVLSNPIFSVFPNPASSSITIDYQGSSSRNTTLEILTTSGQLVKNSTIKSGAGIINIGLAELASGTYILRLTDDQRVESHQLVVH